MAVIPYLLVAACGLKLSLSGETYEQDAKSRWQEMTIAAIALVYLVLMLLAMGFDRLLLSALILFPGTLLFFIACREQGKKVFKFWELVLFTLTAIAAITAVVSFPLSGCFQVASCFSWVGVAEGTLTDNLTNDTSLKTVLYVIFRLNSAARLPRLWILQPASTIPTNLILSWHKQTCLQRFLLLPDRMPLRCYKEQSSI